MVEGDLDVKPALEMLRKMLSAVNGPVLASGTAEADLKVRELALHESLDMTVDDGIYAVEEGKDLAIVLKELDDLLIQTGELSVVFILARVVDRTAIEYIAAAVSTVVHRNSLLV